MGNDFLNRISEIIKDNLSNEQFGVSELAEEIGMSRSNLLRKIKQMTNLSVSQLIRQERLEKAMELLQQDDLNVSEISFRVGFSSTSYFIKCFKDHYGYPPGEAGKMDREEDISLQISQLSGSHQLAAIMFTDIEGYTALMQQDEQKAIEFRNRHREIFKATTRKFKGRILQYYGDGTLSIFNSAIDAVKCGIEMQQAFQMHPQIPVRIGIHSGDIISSKEDIIGDGVNVASRIESLAVAGSVFVSEKVYDEVKNQSGIQAVSLGTFELKNVGKAMEVFAISNPGLVVPDRDLVQGKESYSPRGRGENTPAKGRKVGIAWILLPVAVVILGFFIFYSDFFQNKTGSSSTVHVTDGKKSIAVLPFINDSNDSTNIYIINGLMESILNNLQKIEDLRVISRTTVEKYRNNPKSIPEIARELNAQYFVEGSGQKIGDQILLNIQLIDANSDKHLMGEQYNRETKDVFKLQMEVAKNIAEKIEAVITPEEAKRINKTPTNNLVAYDYVLKGLDLINTGDYEKFEEAIAYFKKAIEEDEEYARPYAATAITYFYLDEGRVDKKHTEEINYYSDKAMLLDPQLPQSLIAKALSYMHSGEYELSVPYFEKALEYNPNYDLVYVFLINLYVNYLPDTEKYLEYALRGLEIDISAYDTTIASINYLTISNAFVQSGFIEEAEKYINISLQYQPDNLYSQYVKAYVLFAKNRDLKQTIGLLLETYSKDPTRYDILQEVGKIYYYLRDYESAYHYYKKFIEIKDAYNLDVYRSEDAKIAIVFGEMGFTDESEKYFEKYKMYSENSPTVYKHLMLSMYYSYMGNTDKALEHLKLFSEEDNYFYWTLIFTDIDPLMDNIKDLPEFRRIMKDIESKFWNYHEEIRKTLEEKELL